MAHLIVDGVARYTLSGVYAGRPWANVLDFRIDTDPGLSEESAVSDFATHLWDAWASTIPGELSEQLTLTKCSWVLLSTADGATGFITTTTDNPGPVPGTDANPTFPANVSVLVTKQAGASRSVRNGRLFVVGYTETATDAAAPDTLTGAALATIQTDWDDFLSAANGGYSVGLSGYDANMQVVHVTARDSEGHPTAGEPRHVDHLVVNSLLATQRRRLRR